MPLLLSHHLLTDDQLAYFIDSTSTPIEKKQTLTSKIVAMSDDDVEIFLQCLETTSDYSPHRTLLEKILHGTCKLTMCTSVCSTF